MSTLSLANIPKQFSSSVQNLLQDSKPLTTEGLILSKNREKLQKIIKVSGNNNNQALFFAKRNISSTHTPSQFGTVQTPLQGQSRQIPLNFSNDIKDLKSSVLGEKLSKNNLQFDSMMNILQKKSKLKKQSQSIQSSKILKSSIMIEDNSHGLGLAQTILLQDDNPYFSPQQQKAFTQNQKGSNIMNLNPNQSPNLQYQQHYQSQYQTSQQNKQIAFSPSPNSNFYSQSQQYQNYPSIMLMQQTPTSQSQFSNKMTSRHLEINQLKSKIAKLEKENQQLRDYFEQVNEFKYAMQDFQDNQSINNIDQRRLLLLKSQVLSLQRQNQVFKETIHSQGKLAAECSQVIKWIQAILEEAQVYRAPKSIARRQNNYGMIDNFGEENGNMVEGIAGSRMRQSNAFDVNQEEVTEQALRNIFKDYHLKNKIEKLRQQLAEAQQNTRKAHASHVLRNNQFVIEEKVKQKGYQNKNPQKQNQKKTQKIGQGKGLMQISQKEREQFDKINLKLDQEKILMVEDKLAVLVKKLLSLNGKLYNDLQIPSSDEFLDICQSLREGIDNLLILGVTPFTQTSFQLMDFFPDSYYTNVINNQSEEWIKFIRDRVGVERLSKYNPFLRKETQIFNNFEVSKLYAYIYLAKESNIKKKDLTNLITNLRRVENRYETSLQLLNKQNDILMRICNQLNIHVEKLTQFNMKQHQFYEKTLFSQIYQPYIELRKFEEKIENSEKERKDLLTFYTKFQSLKENFDLGFSQFLKVEETEIKLNDSIVELVEVYKKNLQRIRDNINDWQKIIEIRTIQNQEEINNDEEIDQNYELQNINEGELLFGELINQD